MRSKINKFEHVGEGEVGLCTERGGQGWGLAQAEPGIEPCIEGARTGVLYRDLPEHTA